MAPGAEASNNAKKLASCARCSPSPPRELVAAGQRFLASPRPRSRTSPSSRTRCQGAPCRARGQGGPIADDSACASMRSAAPGVDSAFAPVDAADADRDRAAPPRRTTPTTRCCCSADARAGRPLAAPRQRRWWPCAARRPRAAGRGGRWPATSRRRAAGCGGFGFDPLMFIPGGSLPSPRCRTRRHQERRQHRGGAGRACADAR